MGYAMQRPIDRFRGITRHVLHHAPKGACARSANSLPEHDR
jgi:hypothetical protein